VLRAPHTGGPAGALRPTLRCARAESYNTPAAAGVCVRVRGHARLVAVRRRLRALAGAPGRPQARSAWLGPWARAPERARDARAQSYNMPVAAGVWVCARKGAVSCALAAAPGARRCAWAPPGAQRLARALGARSRRARDARAESYNTPVAAGVCEGHARLVAPGGGCWHPQVRPGAPLARSAWPRPTPPAPDPRRPCSRAPHLCATCVQARATQSVSCTWRAVPRAPQRSPGSPPRRAAAGPGPHRPLPACTAPQVRGGARVACVRACVRACKVS